MALAQFVCGGPHTVVPTGKPLRPIRVFLWRQAWRSEVR
jgi:hypothetical protein